MNPEGFLADVLDEPRTVAIGISASGGTEETVAALARHTGTSHTIAITNAPDGPLADVADETVALHAGTELGGVSCRTFQATLAVLALMAGSRPPRCAPRSRRRPRCCSAARASTPE